jgi:chaperonin cofactor prefoldin
MSKATKVTNLQKMVEDLEKKIERLELQKKLYLLQLESLQRDSVTETSDEK